MAIDTALRRKMASGVAFLPLGPSVTPTSNPTEAWRAAAAWSFTEQTTQTIPIRRMRQFLLPSDPDNRTLFLDQVELLMRTGIGTSSVPAPQVMLSISRDAGKTWGDELWRNGMAVGEFDARVRWLRLGRYRNAVVRIVVSDPVDWQMVSMMGNVTKGTS